MQTHFYYRFYTDFEEFSLKTLETSDPLCPFVDTLSIQKMKVIAMPMNYTQIAFQINFYFGKFNVLWI